MLNLFIIFFKIGLFSIGGGYAIIPLIQEQVVNNYHWISANTFTDMIKPTDVAFKVFRIFVIISSF